MLLQRRNYRKCGENEEGDQEHELRLTFDHRTIYREERLSELSRNAFVAHTLGARSEELGASEELAPRP